MITDSRELDWELFECSEKLKLTSLMLTGVANSKKKGINLEKLFLEPGEAISERPITKMESLNSLSFEGVEFHNLVQIQDLKVKSLDGMEEFLSIEPFLQSPNSIDMILYHLRTVEIRCIVGSRAELQFIQFLLALSPSLRRLTFTYDTSISDPREKLRISLKIKQFRSASTAAQVVWK
ncbi:hypothetical protein POM88_030702 [Heracleum sosnowskyi]|uniref:FBD domain-containing protein n=1 Tax=Heracleum sosnowskyi TaxID=360622 RepID=A0AAD8MJ21_9APIA|nr:hypothetical protein POM88_030702 [Heracleum sosnowskyi]